MSIFNTTAKAQKTQLKLLYTGKNYQSAFMLVEMIFGVLIFLATLSIAYKYLGMTRVWAKKIGEYNQVIDLLSSQLEKGPDSGNGVVTWKTYSYTPTPKSTINISSYYIPTVTIGVVSARVGEESDAQKITLQTAYRSS